MVDDLTVGAIVQARMKSTRLPGKVLMPLSLKSPKPLLGYIMESIGKCELIDKGIVATSKFTENDPIQKISDENHWEIYRGSEEDVLSRFVEVIDLYKLDVVIRLTADNPFVDLTSLRTLIRLHVSHGNDYTYSAGLPLGMNFEIVRASTLAAISKDERLLDEDREHVTYFITKNDGFKKETVSLPFPASFQDVRLTVDYPSDWALASLLADSIPPGGDLAQSLLTLVEKYPWTKDINRQNFQKRQLSVSEELQIAIDHLELMELRFASSVLKDRISKSR